MTTEDDSFRATGGDSSFGFSTTLGANLAWGAFVRGHRSGVVGVTPVNFEPFPPFVSSITFGVFGCAGGNGPGQPNYADNAGVRGTSRSFTGVAGTSFNRPGVYGQLGDFPNLPADLKAGVLGASIGSTGVLGASIDDIGVSGSSKQAPGVAGSSDAGTGVFGRSTFEHGVQGIAHTAGPDLRSGGIGPVSVPLRAGVFGTASNAIGVAGTSGTSRSGPSYGVYGQSGLPATFTAAIAAGVVGTSRDGSGVVGSSLTAFGAVGSSQTSVGVLGTSGWTGVIGTQTPVGVLGTSGWMGVIGTSPGVVGVAGVCGPPAHAVGPPFDPLAGVLGTSSDHSGVLGVSNRYVGVFGYSGSIGVYGYADTVGVFGEATGPRGNGVWGRATGSNSFAGYFEGNVGVTGNLVVLGAKSAAVPFPDRSRRLLYCVESPVCWCEDFGTARLKNGRATVQLDANFAKVVKLNECHVFLTPEGDCHGLYVRRKGGRSFEVRELQGGTSSIGFSYRIVARRKDVPGERFAKIDITPPMQVGKPATVRGRKAAPSAASMRAMLAALEKQAHTRTKKSAGGGKQPHNLA